MGQHGLINWADDDKACYELTLTLIEQRGAATSTARDKGDQTFGGAEYAGAVGRRRATTLLAAAAAVAARHGLGSTSASSARCRTTSASCASSTATTRRGWPSSARPAPTTSCAPRSSRCTWIGIRSRRSRGAAGDSSKPGWQPIAQDYAAYYEACKRPDSPPMRDPNPTVILIPGARHDRLGQGQERSRA